MKEFAVISTGGKQYQVSVGDAVSIEKITGSHKEGDSIVFDKVLLYDNGKDTIIGAPYVKDASVLATISKTGKKPKVVVVKYKAKSNYLKTRGHRQPFFEVKITSIKTK